MPRKLGVIAAVVAVALLLGAMPSQATVTFALAVTKIGSGGGLVTSDVGGVNCGVTCSADIDAATLVTLTATPDPGTTFIGWSQDCSGSGTCQLTMDAAHSVRARFDLSFRPDEWIQLCGESDGCTIMPLPNPTKGKDVYNTTGTKQTIDVGIEEGEGIRYWITLENDGALDDTFTVDGCNGNKSYKVNNVQVGFYKRPTAGSVQITNEFKAGTATFDMPAGGADVQLTVNLKAVTAQFGVKYTCPITIISQGDGSAKDTVVGKLHTV